MRTESRVITKKLYKIGIKKKTIKILHFFANISGLSAYFSKPIFALKLRNWAIRFEYHEPYNRNDFFFQRNFEAVTPQAKKFRNSKIMFFSVSKYHEAINNE